MKSSSIISVNSAAKCEDASPNPEFLIKSIAEQGYSLETALADLMDNSISAHADKIEVLCDLEKQPFKLYLADNGEGMTEAELSKNMQFPSNSPENNRGHNDLGRFGLGLKTASFSQTRKFTVLSRKKGEEFYSGRTWNIDFLKNNGWKIIINTKQEVANILTAYRILSKNCLNGFKDFSPNTIVVWEGLYKFENYLAENNRRDALKRELNEVTSEHLALVFHRYMEKQNPLQIRVNNQKISAFNPFPEGIQSIEPMQSQFREDIIKIEGFVLPSKSIKESKEGLSKWVTRYRSLLDMEGLYIYRKDRIILFGGWNGLIKKNSKMQLARMKVEVGNNVDNLLHLNVSKSQISVPYELRNAFENYIYTLKNRAEKEFYNRGINKFSQPKGANNEKLFEKISTNRGSLLQVNCNFPLIKKLRNSIGQKQKSELNLILRMIDTRINQIRNVYEEKDFVGIEKEDGITEHEIIDCVKGLLETGVTPKMIKEEILPHFGFKTSSFPEEVKNLLK